MNKLVKSYSLPPSHVEWLRKKSLERSTPQKTVSASSVLEAIISDAIKAEIPLPTETKTKKNAPAVAKPLAI